MWAEVPSLRSNKTMHGIPQGTIVCTSCGMNCVIWLSPGIEKWGCMYCGQKPKDDPTMTQYFNPTGSLMNWDQTITIEKLIAADRIKKCKCNGCKGALFVEEV